VKNVQLGMNVGRQRRKLAQAITDAPDAEHAAYLEHLLGLFDAGVVVGQPQPASQFLPMYEEEFGRG
jgi:hypothetical protein